MRGQPVVFLICCITVAASLWFMIFVRRPFNFWLMMASSTLLLSGLAFWFDGDILHREELTVKNFIIGILSALLLYLIFLVGQWLLINLAKLSPGVFSGSSGFISAVYVNKKALPLWIVGVLLFFPIGFGEEVFWRGLIQKQLGLRIKKSYALLLATFFYTLVHVPTQNPVLILAAAVCGLFWGGIYWKTGSMVPVLISHMIWDPMIFVLLPLM